MMAVKITEKTYPIAFACLWSGTKGTPLKNCLGSYLIINRLETEAFNKKEIFPEYSNCWTSKTDFKRLYTFMYEELEDQFVEVCHK
jgi:hypothetical protein